MLLHCYSPIGLCFASNWGSSDVKQRSPAICSALFRFSAFLSSASFALQPSVRTPSVTKQYAPVPYPSRSLFSTPEMYERATRYPYHTEGLARLLEPCPCNRGCLAPFRCHHYTLPALRLFAAKVVQSAPVELSTGEGAALCRAPSLVGLIFVVTPD